MVRPRMTHLAPQTQASPALRVGVVVSLAIVYVVWSSTYLAVRYAVGAGEGEGLPPMTLGGGRYLLAGLVLFAVAKARGGAWPSAGQWLRTAPIALLFFVMGNGFVAAAERTIDSGVAALVCGTMPLWGALLGRLAGEAIRPREWVGLGLGTLGMLALGAGAKLGADARSWALLGSAPVGWALGSLLVRKLALPKGMMAAAAQMVTGGAMMLALGVAIGERVPAHVPAKAWLALGYLTAAGSLAGFSAYVYLLQNASAPLAMSYAYVNPAVAVLLAAAAGDASIKVTTVASTVLVVLGVVVMVTRRAPGAES